MAPSAPRMVLIIDEHVPPDLTKLFRRRGHAVHLVNRSTIKSEADEVVCALANELGGIVVTFDHRHYALLLARTPQSGAVRFPNAGRISFTCSAYLALQRLQAVIEDVEEEHRRAQSRPDKRVLVTIDKIRFSFER